MSSSDLVEPLAIAGAWLFTPEIHRDHRGAFLEWFRADQLAAAIGHPLDLAQADCTVSSRGTLRGIHFADVPPGQGLYISCSKGAGLDVVVDIRLGSPTFGRWQATLLDDQTRRSVYLAEGLGHAFYALTDETTVIYLCSEPYRPAKEHGVHPLDPALAIDWPQDVSPVLSEKDAAAPSLAEARTAGLLPEYENCLAYYGELARRHEKA